MLPYSFIHCLVHIHNYTDIFKHSEFDFLIRRGDQHRNSDLREMLNMVCIMSLAYLHVLLFKHIPNGLLLTNACVVCSILIVCAA
jgi:hypothetical protein